MSPSPGDPLRPLSRAFFRRDVLVLARELLGMVLLKDGVGGTIIEAEAYREDEPACHAHCGETARNRSMFLDGGYFYVYRIHRSVCCNVVSGRAGSGCAVLIRALLPSDGEQRIAERRGGRPRRIWTDGPGKLCQALGITLADDGQDLLAPRGAVRLVDRGLRFPDAAVRAGPRIGISKATELPWRLWVPDPLGALSAAPDP